MAEVEFNQGTLIVQVQGTDQLWAPKSRLEIPLSPLRHLLSGGREDLLGCARSRDDGCDRAEGRSILKIGCGGGGPARHGGGHPGALREGVALHTILRPFSRSVYRPNPRSKRCSCTFSDSVSLEPFFVRSTLGLRQLLDWYSMRPNVRTVRDEKR